MKDYGDCPKHPGVKLVCPAEIGAKGGSTPSEERAKWARINGKLGGRPREKKKRKARKVAKTVLA